MKDPTVRMDGKCRQCKGPRVVPKGRYVDRSVYESDPFCSSQCCRLWHGVDGHVQVPLVCTGCGGDLEGVTADCSQCAERERRRRNRVLERVAA